MLKISSTVFFEPLKLYVDRNLFKQLSKYCNTCSDSQKKRFLEFIPFILIPECTYRYGDKAKKGNVEYFTVVTVISTI